MSFVKPTQGTNLDWFLDYICKFHDTDDVMPIMELNEELTKLNNRSDTTVVADETAVKITVRLKEPHVAPQIKRKANELLEDIKYLSSMEDDWWLVETPKLNAIEEALKDANQEAYHRELYLYAWHWIENLDDIHPDLVEVLDANLRMSKVYPMSNELVILFENV